MAHASHRYVPAAGLHAFLALYDPLLAIFTSERAWRGKVLSALELSPGHRLLDIGCGTGSFAVMAARAVPAAEIHGLDPDTRALARAERKAGSAGVRVNFREGLGSAADTVCGPQTFDRIVSSLAFHHFGANGRSETLAAALRALKPGGLLCIADFVDGHFAAIPAARLQTELEDAGFVQVREAARFRLLFSPVVVLTARKAG